MSANASPAETNPQVILGFHEPPETSTSLLRHRFPSKIGGLPAWLDPVNLPTPAQLSSPVDCRPMAFLLQVYAPLDEQPAAFHRTVFVFISQSGDQLSKPGAVRAFRCQMPRGNDFYPFHPPKAADVLPPQLPAEQLASSTSRDPWQVAANERRSPQPAGSSTAGGIPVYPEAELVQEPEPEEGDEADQQLVQRALEQYQQRVAQEGEYDENELPEDLMDQLEAGVDEEKMHFADFQTRIAREPEQVVRYCFQKGAKTLWPSPRHKPEAHDIPACPHCGQLRRFEFQVLPQLLNHLDVDAADNRAPDWGTIAVYSCPASCRVPVKDGSAYHEEFVWVQPS